MRKRMKANMRWGKTDKVKGRKFRKESKEEGKKKKNN